MRNTFKEALNGTPIKPMSCCNRLQQDMSPDNMLDRRMDPIIQQYNSHWGVISNTNLIKDPNNPEQYIINGGSAMTAEQWSWFICSSHWGGYEFKFIDSSGVRTMSLVAWAYQMGMTIVSDVPGVRGILRNNYPDDLANIQKGVATYTTSESCIPRPIQELEKEPGTINNILSESKSIEEILEKLNKNNDVLVNEWYYAGDRFVGKFWGSKLVAIKPF